MDANFAVITEPADALWGTTTSAESMMYIWGLYEAAEAGLSGRD